MNQPHEPRHRKSAKTVSRPRARDKTNNRPCGETVYNRLLHSISSNEDFSFVFGINSTHIRRTPQRYNSLIHNKFLTPNS